MIVYLDNLSEYFGYEKGSLIIHVFEGLRDIKTQKKLFDEKFNTILKNNCNLSQEEAYIETCKWVSPYIDNVPAHATGGAVDIILWDDKQKKYCDMGRFNVGGNEAPTFSQSSRLTSEQKNNRLLFYCAATEAGLVNYAYEWWHFSINDKYATYWKNYVFNKNDNASYGVV
jgi:D-alanyl-D-alanine dipeptidase